MWAKVYNGVDDATGHNHQQQQQQRQQ